MSTASRTVQACLTLYSWWRAKSDFTYLHKSCF